MGWGRRIGTVGCIDREIVCGESAQERMKVMPSSKS
jgi:hypothetical protein